MRVGVSVAVCVALVAAQLPSGAAWAKRWDLSKRFKALGHAELECDGKSQPAECCICRSIVHEIETQLDSTPDDYELDVVFRISEEKKKIKYSRSEARILEVLDSVCDRLPLKLPDATKKSQRLLSDACNSFVGVYEDELTRVFFNDFTSATQRACADTIRVCQDSSAQEATKQEL